MINGILTFPVRRGLWGQIKRTDIFPQYKISCPAVPDAKTGPDKPASQKEQKNGEQGR